MKRKNYIIIMIIILIIIATSIVIKSNIKEEIPFSISNIRVVSTADAINNENSEERWNLKIILNNDVYINIEKKYSGKDIIDKIIIDNFNALEVPQKGDIYIYRPASGRTVFKNTEEYKIQDELILTGDRITDLENSEVSNKGGHIVLRIANENLVNYVSDLDDNITYDSSLFKKAGITQEELEFDISFDISIELKSGEKYKTTIKLSMPKEDFLDLGNVVSEINGNDIIFTRYE